MSRNENSQLLLDCADNSLHFTTPETSPGINEDREQHEIEPLDEEVTKLNKYEGKKKDQSGFMLLFKPTKEGSKKAGIIGEMAAIFGAAILGLPYNLKETGLILGSSFILFGGLMNYLSIKCLMNVSYRKKFNSFTECVYGTFGKFGGKLFEYCMMFHCFCAFVNYQMLGAKFAHDTCKTMGWFPDFVDTQYFKAAQVLIFATIVLPFALKKEIYALRHATTWSLIIIAYILVVITVQFPYYVQRHLKNPHININWASINWSLPDTFAVTTFAYLCTPNIFQVRNELKNTREKKMEYVNYHSNLFVGILYMLTGIVGYLSFLDQTPQFVNLRPASSPQDPDYMMKLGQIAIAISIGVFATAIRVAPGREQVISFFKLEAHKDNSFLHVPLTAALVYTSAGVAIWYPDCHSYLSLVGGTVGTMISIIFPCGCYIVSTKNWPLQKVCALFAVFVGIILGFAAGWINIQKILT